MFIWFSSGDAYRANMAESLSLVPDATDLTSWLTAQRNQTPTVP